MHSSSEGILLPAADGLPLTHAVDPSPVDISILLGGHVYDLSFLRVRRRPEVPEAENSAETSKVGVLRRRGQGIRRQSVSDATQRTRHWQVLSLVNVVQSPSRLTRPLSASSRLQLSGGLITSLADVVLYSWSSLRGKAGLCSIWLNPSVGYVGPVLTCQQYYPWMSGAYGH